MSGGGIGGRVSGDGGLGGGVRPFLSEIGPGVLGYTVEVEGALWIPFLMADRPGHGDVGRYLDDLPRDRAVKVPNVLSDRLAGMLRRRGFRERTEYDPGSRSLAYVWVREAG